MGVHDMKKNIFIILIALSQLSIFAQRNGGESSGVNRYAIFVGSNNGGKQNQRLLYAGTDAISFQKTMAEIGGIPKANGILLLDPTKADLDEAINTISYMIKQNKQRSKRSEFIFYYSGHSDANALLLGKTNYAYSNLKSAISNVPSDVHVVILDSCYSGNFIRTKGGQKKKPFLVDDASVVKGHAYLSSSSSQEFSQESDEIGSSFFTNAIVTGLRGAADSSGDKKVTLNELYSYAFNETLSKTENSSAGPQHPNYNITLVGSGDLVLSDISNSDSIVKLSSDLIGRIIIRDQNGKLVSEINKTERKPVFLALENGNYKATLISNSVTLNGEFYLRPGKVHNLSSDSLSPVASSFNRLRGEESDGESNTDELFVPVEFSLLNNELSRDKNKKIVTAFSLGLFRSKVYKTNGLMLALGVNDTDYLNGIQSSYIYNKAGVVRGVQDSYIMNRAGSLWGIQASGIYNDANELHGLQLSGIYNYSEDMHGAQFSGIINNAAKMDGYQAAGICNLSKETVGCQMASIFNYTENLKTKGVQIGLVNVAKETQGFQIGLLNLSKNGILEFGTSYTSNNNIRMTLCSGNHLLYTTIGAAGAPEDFFTKSGVEDAERIFIAGLGSRFNYKNFNFDIEGIANIASYKKDEAEIAEEKANAKDEEDVFEYELDCFPSLRLAVGYTPVKHLQVFGAANFAFEFDSNKDTFERLEDNISFKGGNITIHPEFEAGIKITLN